MTDSAVVLIDAEIGKLQAEQNALRAQVAALDTPIAALVRVKRTLMGDGEPKAESEKKVRRKPAPDEPLKFPGTDVPVRTPQDAAEVLSALERMEAEGR